MKSKILVLIFLAFILQSYVHSQTSNYVKIEGQKFILNGSDYYPVAVNYLVQITKNHTNNSYYLSPNWNHSNEWGWPNTGGDGRFIYSTTDDIGVSHNKLVNDMSKMSGRGINTLRVCGLGVNFENGAITYPGGCSETVYFEKIEELLNILQTYNLKAILLIGAPMDVQYDMVYIEFLTRLSTRLKNRTALMGYDFLNEPSTFNGGNQKYIISSRISNWHYSIKKNAPNHLTTIGYSYTIAAVIDWDPAMHPVDFASFHIYAWSKDVQLSKNIIASSLKWYSNTIQKPWIIGETGYSGTNITSVNDNRVGTETQQKDFADFTMQRALDCNCSGYTWWQFQEINWRNPWEDYLGLITHFDKNLQNNGEKEKLVMQSFKNFNPNNINVSNCVKPSNYYNMWGKTYLRNQGRVVDNQGNPIKDAVIDRSGITFTDENGYFKYYTEPTGNYYTLSITAPGYSVVQISNPASNVGTITLNPVNYMNCWLKKWTNNNSDWIDGHHIQSFDKFYPGDFDGDGLDELLCVVNTGNENGDYITMLDYFDNDWHWKWSNNGDKNLGSGIYQYRDEFIIGDFNGDGKDEILGHDLDGWITLFSYENNNIVWKWSAGNSHDLYDYRSNLIAGDFNGDGQDEILGNDIDNNGYITLFRLEGFTQPWDLANADFVWKWTDEGSHAMQPYKDNLIAGDFNGDGQDEILGNDIDNNGWITLFRLEGFTQPWDLANADFVWKWSDGGDDYHGIYPYRDNLIVGNFDSDPADEILGIDTWATKFDFINNDWYWSWSTEGTALLGDWSVNENNTFFFLKADLNEPEYFMVLNQNTSSDFCNMYLKNPLEGTNTINTFTVPFTVSGTNVNETNKWDVQGCDGADKAYKFYLPQSSKIKATLCSNLTNFDTKFEIFKEDGTRTNYYNNDYSCSFNNLYSTINGIQLAEGYYYAVVDGYCGRTGNYELSVTIDNTKSAITISTDNIIILSDTDDLGKYDSNKEVTKTLNEINVFPNPAKDMLNIILPDNLQYRIELIDVNGKSIKSFINVEGIINMDCSDVNSGIYLLKVSSSEKIHQQKIVITK
jgi:hypothetical protein